MLDTPSQTTRTAVVPTTASAIASSLRLLRRPLSQTPPTSADGSSVQWSRALTASSPQCSQ